MRLKRTISLLLAVCMLIALFPTAVKADTGDKLIALTFDDGPHNKYTKQLLDGLKERGVNVTFFILGSRVSSNLELVKRAYDEGHEIASHTYSHLNLNLESSAVVRSELIKTSAALDQACGSGTEYLVRPPYGNANASVLSVMDAPAIIWSVDTNDWKYKDSDHVCNHIVNNAADGAIILCHDIHSTTIPGALRAIDKLLDKGYEFVTVSELYRRRGVELKDGVRYGKCSPTGMDAGSAAAPVITYEPADGGVRITMDSPSGAPIYYSLDGSRITQNSTRYTESFVTGCPVNIKAVAAYDLNGDRSDTVTFSLTLSPCASPELEMDGSYMKLSCDTPGAPVYYTIDGTAATTDSIRYTEPVSLEPGTVIRFVAGGGDTLVSAEIKMYYSEQGHLFADVFPGLWYCDTIDTLTTIGLMNGVGNYRFAPDEDTSRAMLVTMLYRAYGEKLEEGWKRTNQFTDVMDGRWYSEAVEWAYRNGIVKGYPDQTFRHDKAITRQEMAQMCAGFLGYLGYSLETDKDCRSRFEDGASIAAWALESVNGIVDAGLMVGDKNGNMNPEKTATRAETGTVVLRLFTGYLLDDNE